MIEPLSTCCGAPPLGEIHSAPPDRIGLCSDCRDHCTFEDEETDEENNARPARNSIDDFKTSATFHP